MTSSPTVRRLMLVSAICLTTSLMTACGSLPKPGAVAGSFQAQCFTQKQLDSMARAQKEAALSNNTAAGKRCN